jgi:hypothetical protein
LRAVRALVELAQDVPEVPVHLFEHGDVLVGRDARQPTQPGHGRVYPVVARRRKFDHRRLAGGCHGRTRPLSFGIRVLTFFPSTIVWVFLVHVRYPPRGTLPSDVD